MKYKRLNAVFASVIIHILIALIIGLLLSEHYWGFDRDAFDVEFVNYKPARDTRLNQHRVVHLPTTQRQVDSSSVHLPTISQIQTSNPTFQNVTPTTIDNTDVFNNTDTFMPTVQAEMPQRSLDVEQKNAIGVPSSTSISPKIKSRSPVVVRPKSNTPTTDGFTEYFDNTIPEGSPSEKLTTTLQNPVLLPQGELGAILEGTGEDLRGHIRIIRLKHSLSDWWQDPTALPALMRWMDKNTTIRLDMSVEGGSLRLTDPMIMGAPLIIMTGHDKDITVGRGLVKEGPLEKTFSEQERAALRKYIVDEGGMLFFDDCGFHGLFAHIVVDELTQIFPEYPLEIIPHEHEIYTIHYHLLKPPIGGDVFWGNENNAQPTQFRYQKGITIDNRLAVVYNRKDYMCAMETAEIQSRTMLRLRRSPDVYRFMTNLMIYALKYGGNTDRSGYTEK